MSTRRLDNRQVVIGHRIELRNSQTTLENLPSELRFHLLCSIKDLRTLKGLVRSSPTYHAQYRLDRDNILRHCLEVELHGFYIDAVATSSLVFAYWLKKDR